MFTAGSDCEYDDEDERRNGKIEDERRTSKNWLPKFSQSAIDCLWSTLKGRSKTKEDLAMAEMYYNALQSELGISNPYLNDGRGTPNAEIYRRSWKLDPFPALPGDKKRRCRSESDVAMKCVKINNCHHSASIGRPADELTQKKNWLKESKTKLEELLRRSFFVKKSTHGSSSGFQKHKSGAKISGKKNVNSSHRWHDTSTEDTPRGDSHANGIQFTSRRSYEDDCILTDSYPHGCDPNLWREKLEKWAASLQCAIQVIKREECLRQEIDQLRGHRFVLERQLEEISIEKERWRRKCLQLQKDKRRSVEGIVCRQCGGAEFHLKNGNLALPIVPTEIDSPDEVVQRQNRMKDDEIFRALHELLTYNT